MLFLLVIIIVVVAIIVLKKRAKQNAEHSSAVQAAFSSVLEEEEANDDSGDSDDDGAAQSEESDSVEAASGGGIDCSNDGINPTLLKAAEMGNENAIADVALMYFLGNGVKRNWEKANMWFGSADFSDAFDEDGDPNYSGISDWAKNKENCEEAAFHVLEMAVAEGKEKDYSTYVNAAFELAQCYENGDGVEVDLEKALYWYEQVSDVFGKDTVKRIKRMLDKSGG